MNCVVGRMRGEKGILHTSAVASKAEPSCWWWVVELRQECRPAVTTKNSSHHTRALRVANRDLDENGCLQTGSGDGGSVPSIPFIPPASARKPAFYVRIHSSKLPSLISPHSVNISTRTTDIMYLPQRIHPMLSIASSSNIPVLHAYVSTC